MGCAPICTSGSTSGRAPVRAFLMLPLVGASPRESVHVGSLLPGAGMTPGSGAGGNCGAPASPTALARAHRDAVGRRSGSSLSVTPRSRDPAPCRCSCSSVSHPFDRFVPHDLADGRDAVAQRQRVAVAFGEEQVAVGVHAAAEVEVRDRRRSSGRSPSRCRTGRPGSAPSASARRMRTSPPWSGARAVTSIV